MTDDIRKELEELRRIEMEKIEVLSKALDIIYDEQSEEECVRWEKKAFGQNRQRGTAISMRT